MFKGIRKGRSKRKEKKAAAAGKIKKQGSSTPIKDVEIPPNPFDDNNYQGPSTPATTGTSPSPAAVTTPTANNLSQTRLAAAGAEQLSSTPPRPPPPPPPPPPKPVTTMPISPRTPTSSSQPQSQNHPYQDQSDYQSQPQWGGPAPPPSSQAPAVTVVDHTNINTSLREEPPSDAPRWLQKRYRTYAGPVDIDEVSLSSFSSMASGSLNELDMSGSLRGPTVGGTGPGEKPFSSPAKKAWLKQQQLQQLAEEETDHTSATDKQFQQQQQQKQDNNNNGTKTQQYEKQQEEEEIDSNKQQFSETRQVAVGAQSARHLSGDSMFHEDWSVVDENNKSATDSVFSYYLESTESLNNVENSPAAGTASSSHRLQHLQQRNLSLENPLPMIGNNNNTTTNTNPYSKNILSDESEQTPKEDNHLPLSPSLLPEGTKVHEQNSLPTTTTPPVVQNKVNNTVASSAENPQKQQQKDLSAGITTEPLEAASAEENFFTPAHSSAADDDSSSGELYLEDDDDEGAVKKVVNTTPEKPKAQVFEVQQAQADEVSSEEKEGEPEHNKDALPNEEADEIPPKQSENTMETEEVQKVGGRADQQEETKEEMDDANANKSNKKEEIDGRKKHNYVDDDGFDLSSRSDDLDIDLSGNIIDNIPHEAIMANQKPHSTLGPKPLSLEELKSHVQDAHLVVRTILDNEDVREENAVVTSRDCFTAIQKFAELKLELDYATNDLALAQQKFKGLIDECSNLFTEDILASPTKTSIQTNKKSASSPASALSGTKKFWSTASSSSGGGGNYDLDRNESHDNDTEELDEGEDEWILQLRKAMGGSKSNLDTMGISESDKYETCREASDTVENEQKDDNEEAGHSQRKEEIQKFYDNLLKQIKMIQATLKQRNADIRRLENNLQQREKTSRVILATASTEAAVKTEKVGKLCKEIEQLNNELSSAQSELTDVKELQSSTEIQINELKDQMDKLKKEKAQSEALSVTTIKVLNKRIQDNEHKISDNSTEIDSLKQDISDLNETITQLEEKNRLLEDKKNLDIIKAIDAATTPPSSPIATKSLVGSKEHNIAKEQQQNDNNERSDSCEEASEKAEQSKKLEQEQCESNDSIDASKPLNASEETVTCSAEEYMEMKTLKHNLEKTENDHKKQQVEYQQLCSEVSQLCSQLRSKTQKKAKFDDLLLQMSYVRDDENKMGQPEDKTAEILTSLRSTVTIVESTIKKKEEENEQLHRELNELYRMSSTNSMPKDHASQTIEDLRGQLRTSLEKERKSIMKAKKIHMQLDMSNKRIKELEREKELATIAADEAVRKVHEINEKQKQQEIAQKNQYEIIEMENEIKDLRVKLQEAREQIDELERSGRSGRTPVSSRTQSYTMQSMDLDVIAEETNEVRQLQKQLDQTRARVEELEQASAHGVGGDGVQFSAGLGYVGHNKYQGSGIDSISSIQSFAVDRNRAPDTSDGGADEDIDTMDVRTLCRKYTRIKNSLDRTQQEYELVNAEVIELRGQLIETQTVVEDLEQERLFSRAKISELSELVKTRSKNSTGVTSELELDLMKKAEECASLNAELETVRQKLQEKTDRVEKLEQTNEANSALVKELSMMSLGNEAASRNNRTMDSNNNNKDESATTVEAPSSAVLNTMLAASQERAEQLQKERNISMEKAATLSIELAESRATIDELTETIKEQEKFLLTPHSDHGMAGTNRNMKNAFGNFLRKGQGTLSNSAHGIRSRLSMDQSPSHIATKPIEDNADTAAGWGMGIGNSLKRLGGGSQSQSHQHATAAAGVFGDESQRSGVSGISHDETQEAQLMTIKNLMQRIEALETENYDLRNGEQ